MVVNEDLFYVMQDRIGISVWDNSNDTMLSCGSCKDKNKWLKFNLSDAKAVADFTGFDIILAY